MRISDWSSDVCSSDLREYRLTDPHGRSLLGKVDEKGADTDLSTVRRPGFFARAPYREPIAAADGDTFVVEFSAPPEAYERLHGKADGPVRIRGWYIRGAGIDDGRGGRRSEGHTSELQYLIRITY